MRLLFFLFVSFGIISLSHGQYNISSNPKCIAAFKNKTMNGDKLLITATNFFEYPQNGDRNEWLILLSKDCYVKGKPGEETRLWWNYLANRCIKYEILGQAPEIRVNQKFIYFKLWSRDGYIGEKRLVLIEENGAWKVNSIDL